MSDHVSLDAHALRDALAVLQREQASYLPTERELTRYRWFSVFAYLTAAVFGLVVTLAMLSDGIRSAPTAVVFGLLSIVFAVTMFGTIVLFALNTSLSRKLFRLARLRKRLNLADYVAEALHAARHPVRRFGTVMTHLVSIAGWLLILAAFFGTIGVVVGFRDEAISVFALGAVYVAMFLVGVSCVSLRYMRRGKQQLEVVLRLQRTLTDHTAEQDVKLSTGDYDAIASIERQQIIRDRATSIATARKQTREWSYMCQTSRQMYLAKSKLPPDVLQEVERAIEQLLVNPPGASGRDRATAKTVPVVGTGLQIHYDVDPVRHLVRLHDLRPEADRFASA